jgi:tetratricopeptide (TPR) repeat protein
VKVLSPEAMLARLGNRLALLAGGAQDQPTRHHSLRAAVEWSHALLGPAERVVFRRLGVFVGGCAIEAAEAVCPLPLTAPDAGTRGTRRVGRRPGDAETAHRPGQHSPRPRISPSPRLGEVGREEVLDLLSSLVDKSLLRRAAGRFSMLETIRQFALERLGEVTDIPALRSRHASHYLALGEAAEPELRGPAQQSWLERLERDHDNLRVALSWLGEAGDAEAGLRLAAALWRFWRLHNHLLEGRRVLATFLGMGEATPATLRARALVGASRLAMDAGDTERSLADAEEALAAAQESGVAEELAAATENLGLMTILSGELARAVSLLEESIDRFRRLGDSVGAADALNNLANAFMAAGETGRATEAGEEALALQRQAENTVGTAFILHTLGYVALHQGDFELARARLGESLVLFQELGDVSRIADTLEGMANVAAGHGDDRRAIVLWAAGESIRAEAGKQMEPPEAALHDSALSAVRGRVGEAAFALGSVEGATLEPDDAVSYALASTPNPSESQGAGAALGGRR